MPRGFFGHADSLHGATFFANGSNQLILPSLREHVASRIEAWLNLLQRYPTSHGNDGISFGPNIRRLTSSQILLLRSTLHPAEPAHTPANAPDTFSPGNRRDKIQESARTGFLPG